MRWFMSGKYPSGTHAGGGTIGNAGNASGIGAAGTGFGNFVIAFGPAGGGVGLAGGAGAGTAAGVTGVGVGEAGGAAAAGGTGGTAVYHRKSVRCRRCAISRRSDCANFTHGLRGKSCSRRRIVSTAAARS